MQGDEITRAANKLAASAINAFERTQGAPPEPG
jgi:hypothetical protein